MSATENELSGDPGPLWELDVLVVRRLREHPLLAERTHWLSPATDTAFPYLTVYRHDGGLGMLGTFDGEQRDILYLVRAAARLRKDAAILAQAADEQLRGHQFPEVSGFRPMNVAEWRGIVPAPGNILPDRSRVYYEGGQYMVRLEELASAA
jgi:hypothetical protein